jgi:phosphoglycerate dehydrogenase-like enzyme
MYRMAHSKSQRPGQTRTELTQPRAIAVLDDYLGAAADLADWTPVREAATVDFFSKPISELEAPKALGEYDAICLMRDRMPIPRKLIAQLPRLKLIVTVGGRIANLDFDAARERGIEIVSATEYVGRSLNIPVTGPIELAWALILALSRAIPLSDRAVREGDWQTCLSRQLHGQTLGIAGLGRFGSMMVPIAHAFGMSVLGWSRSLDQTRARSLGIRKVGWEELLREADYLSLHLPLNSGTAGIIGAAELAPMKSSSFLVNTSRGPIVNEAALISALEKDQIAGAGLDVYDTEPLPSDHRLATLSNVVLTPHIGFVTEETMRAFYRATAEVLLSWLRHG